MASRKVLTAMARTRVIVFLRVSLQRVARSRSAAPRFPLLGRYSRTAFVRRSRRFSLPVARRGRHLTRLRAPGLGARARVAGRNFAHEQVLERLAPGRDRNHLLAGLGRLAQAAASA